MRARISVGPSSSSRLSSSRPPRLGRPPGRRARSAPPTLDPATTHKGIRRLRGKRGTSRIRLQGVSHTRCVSPSPQPASPEQRLIIISGEEGAGKSTIVRALLPPTPYGARIDAEDIGQTNPCPMDDTFFDLLRRNVAGLVENFWAAGYVNVIAGSFLRRYSDYVSFRQLLRPSAVFLIDLLAGKEVRDHRRITRAKRATQEWRLAGKCVEEIEVGAVGFAIDWLHRDAFRCCPISRRARAGRHGGVGEVDLGEVGDLTHLMLRISCTACRVESVSQPI